MTENLRIIEILRNGIWYNSVFEDIECGDLFRMFDPPDNTPVPDANGSYIFKATSDVYKHNTYGVLTVDTIGVYNNDEELGMYPE